MPTEPQISANNRQFILQSLSAKRVRLDGRPLDQYRPVKIEFCETGYGYADVQLGKTRVAARVSVEVARPNPDRKFDGIVTFSLEFSPMVAPSAEVGRPSITEHLLSRHLEKSLIRSSAIDTESLCLIAGSKCFHLRIDIHVLAHDGNLLDASSIASIAALRHFRRPDFEVSGEDVVIFSADERQPVPISIRHSPFIVTVSFFPATESGQDKVDEDMLDDQDDLLIPVIDATRAEENVRVTDLVVAANKYGEICVITKAGTGINTISGGLEPSSDVDARLLLSSVKQATKIVVDLDKIVASALEEDERRRTKNGVLARELKADNER